MKAPISWLNEFVDLDIDVKTFAHKMTMSGSKVEGIEIQAEEITGVVIGKILKIEPHPDADRLQICTVDINTEVLQIVTAAKNVFEGAVIPVACAGADLADGLKIKKGKLRGVESNGMMCSVEELGMSNADVPDAVDDGIYIFNVSEIEREKSPAGTNMQYTTNDHEVLSLGMDAKKAFGIDQVTVDFEITPNRPDCLGIYGIALEAAATLGKECKKYDFQLKEQGPGKASDYIDVEVLADDLCSRYIARVIKNVKIAPSPKWMRERLLAAGVRSINNVVDITNYVMLELGQPLHAFDARDLTGSKIKVRRAAQGEKMITLDDQERILDADMLVIADEIRPVCIAGIMGGQNSGIKDDTVEVVFESAMFSGPSVRSTSRKLGLRSESSSRFEKGLDAERSMDAALRACQLVEILNCGEVVPGMVDLYRAPATPRKVAFEYEKINNHLGTDISKEQMVRYLVSLSLKPDSDRADDVTAFEIPSFRKDIEGMGDLAEEVARLYDYNKIKPTLLDCQQTTLGQKTFKQNIEDSVIQILNSCGYSEIYTYSFGSAKEFDKLRLDGDDPLRNAVVISNPLGEDYSIMRTTTISGLLDVIEKNSNRRIDSAKIFELSKVYLPVEGEELPDERQVISIGAYGEEIDFYAVKGTVETLLQTLGITRYSFKPVKDNRTFHPGRTAELWIGEKKVGIIGEIHPQVSDNYHVPQRTYAAAIELQPLVKNAKDIVKFRPLPKFPAVTRDIAVILNEDIWISDITALVTKLGGKILEETALFDVYQGTQVPEGKKSVAYSLIFRANDKTLTDEEVSKVMKKINEGLNKQFQAELR